MTATESSRIINQIDAVLSGHVTDDGTIDDAMRWSPEPVEDASPFGPPIDVYTRAQAIADGGLVEVPSAVSREAGISVPVALTRAVFEDCVAWDEADNRRKGIVNDQDGRLWDVVFMTRQAIRRNRDSSRARVQLYRVPRSGRARAPRLVELVAVIGPGDAGEPVLTIQEIGED